MDSLAPNAVLNNLEVWLEILVPANKGIMIVKYQFANPAISLVKAAMEAFKLIARAVIKMSNSECWLQAPIHAHARSGILMFFPPKTTKFANLVQQLA